MFMHFTMDISAKKIVQILTKKRLIKVPSSVQSKFKQIVELNLSNNLLKKYTKFNTYLQF